MEPKSKMSDFKNIFIPIFCSGFLLGGCSMMPESIDTSPIVEESIPMNQPDTINRLITTCMDSINSLSTLHSNLLVYVYSPDGQTSANKANILNGIQEGIDTISYNLETLQNTKVASGLDSRARDIEYELQTLLNILESLKTAVAENDTEAMTELYTNLKNSLGNLKTYGTLI